VIVFLATVTDDTVPQHWSGQMLDWTVELGIVVIVACMLMCIYRLLRGPHLADRAMAVDTLGIALIGFVLLYGIRLQTLMFIDGVLVLSLLAFATTVAMAQFIARPHLQCFLTQRPRRGSTNNMEGPRP
jgi:multicomponent K+:H+ antiporter subunit F